MKLTTYFFDLDDTIYPSISGIWQLIKQRVYLFMDEKYGIPHDEAVELSRRFVNEYGTTYKGLCNFYTVNEDDYFDFVHNIPIEDHLIYDPDLVATLEALPGKKFILTNATSPHAIRVLDRLRVSHFFTNIIDIKDMAPYCKPSPEAFAKALAIAGNPPAERCLMVHDLENNTKGAMQVGFHSILFGKTETTPNCHAAFDNWREIGTYLKEMNNAS
jgi:pyrimidine 5'-nucleotidase